MTAKLDSWLGKKVNRKVNIDIAYYKVRLLSWDLCKYKINDTNFLAPDAHFDNTCLFSDARGQNI